MTDLSKLAELERRGQYDDAAELAEQLALPQRAAQLWERACRFDHAARRYLETGQVDTALLLAVRARAQEIVEDCLARIEPGPRSDALVLRLETLGQWKVAAEVQHRLGNHSEAAACFERAEDLLAAAELFHLAGRLDDAIRVLERFVTSDPARFSARFGLALLLERRGEFQRAARCLQAVPPAAAEYPAALNALARLLNKLDLPGASREVLRELSQTGNPNPELPGLSMFATASPPPHPRSMAGDAHAKLMFGRYEVTERVASTATAQVFRARDRVRDQDVAVKLFSPNLLSGTGRDAFFRFEREVEVMRELSHAAVVPLLAYHAQGPALILRWMAGGSLAERLTPTQGPRITAKQGALVASRVLTALGEAHRRGILHRDIKPANILFDEHSVPYLADFGTAHVADHAQTVTQGLIGTLAYMAPEQRQGQAANIRSDLYSVGAVFWHILSGAPPLQGGCLLEELSARQRELAQRLIDPAQLPTRAAEMRDLIDQENWPDASPNLSVTRVEPLLDMDVNRLVDREHGSFDSLLERSLEVVTPDPDMLERLQRFAVADHPGLVSILCSEAGETQVWLERLPLYPERRLAPGQRASLTAALERLHAVGGQHGAVNEDHLGWRGSQPALLFPHRKTTATLAEDLANLARID